MMTNLLGERPKALHRWHRIDRKLFVVGRKPWNVEKPADVSDKLVSLSNPGKALLNVVISELRDRNWITGLFTGPSLGLVGN